MIYVQQKHHHGGVTRTRQEAVQDGPPSKERLDQLFAKPATAAVVESCSSRKPMTAGRKDPYWQFLFEKLPFELQDQQPAAQQEGANSVVVMGDGEKREDVDNQLARLCDTVLHIVSDNPKSHRSHHHCWQKRHLKSSSSAPVFSTNCHTTKSMQRWAPNERTSSKTMANKNTRKKRRRSTTSTAIKTVSGLKPSTRTKPASAPTTSNARWVSSSKSLSAIDQDRLTRMLGLSTPSLASATSKSSHHNKNKNRTTKSSTKSSITSSSITKETRKPLDFSERQQSSCRWGTTIPTTTSDSGLSCPERCRD